jgi:hypothetical protein
VKWRDEARNGIPNSATPSATPDVYEIQAPDGYRCLVVYDEKGGEFGRVQLREYAMDDALVAARLQAFRDQFHPRRPALTLEPG